jgi:hypothetical protein
MAAQKLTLSIEPGVIDKAKKYAKQKHTSISKLVENYLDDISDPKKNKDKLDEMKVADWVKQLVIVDKPTPDFDHKKEYRDYIIKKYS